MIILGVDPSKTATGLVVCSIRGDSIRVMASMTCKNHKDETLAARISLIKADATEMYRQWDCERIAIERNVQGFYIAADGEKKNKSPQSTIDQAILIGAVGFLGEHLPLLIPPATAKKALTGHGGASKTQMVKMARLIATNWRPKETDRARKAEADAIGVAIAGANLAGARAV